jgi:outer membrane biosynthesis protein TonB
MNRSIYFLPVLFLLVACSAPSRNTTTVPAPSESPSTIPSPVTPSIQPSPTIEKPSPTPTPSLSDQPVPIAPKNSTEQPSPTVSPSPTSEGITPIREPVSGSCECPYDTDNRGRSCGRRSAYSRPGGTAPACYK